MPSVSCFSNRLACSGRVSWSSKQVLLLTGEVDGPFQGGVTLFQGEFSTPTGWLDKPLVHVYLRYFLTDSVAKFDGKIHNYYVECQNERNESIAYRRVTDGRTDGQSDRQHLVTAEQPVTAW